MLPARRDGDSDTMKTFTLQLQDAAQSERITGLRAFVGEDASGSFAILANHARMMTVLVTGLARYRQDESHWQYLAMPGAVLYFDADVLALYTRHYLRDTDYTRISAALQEQLLAEEQRLQTTRDSLRRMEESLLRRLWELGYRGG
jgi:F-type H+-transporting ATPase subunit epsilon